ncbi:ABC transporter permease [Cupriavidus basilensis]|uniref:ABC transporter permease n=1 Tax=Cupriavidus basilensis TaxID=68895 RepID=A0ABT6ARF4_9BURK|nr:FtsX-like permease family protein [Cupriavidus basilensis]MDF3834837.1 ABC transporter permease [Cupriavidus basilensis]
MTLEHRLAMRNLLRNRRRSALTALIIVATVALMTVFQGLSDGGHRAMIDVGVRMGLGHLIVSQRGYADNPGLDRLIGKGEALSGQLQAALPMASHVVPRLRLNAMAQAGGNTVAVTASGVVPRLESQVSGIADRKAILTGEPLAQDDAGAQGGKLPPIVIGSRLARSLAVGLGDRLTLTVKPATGSDFARAAFRVAGIFHTGMVELDAFWVELPLAEAQRLARTGDEVSEIALYLHDESALDAAAAALRQVLRDQPLQVRRWSEAAPELYSAVMLDAAGMYLLMVIVFIVVAAGILNTIVMSVMKRAREFSVMLALGAQPALVTRVVLREALYLAAFSVALGLAIGYSAHLHFATEGLNFREIFGTSLEAGGVLLPDRFYSSLQPDKLLFGAGFVFLLTVVVTVYPAIKAGRLSPLQASQHG